MAQLTVQIVTHDEEFRKQVATMVRACGVPVGITEGRSTIEGAGPDLVVVDIRTDVSSGMAAIERLRAGVGSEIRRLQQAANVVAAIDVLATFAEVAEREGYSRPEMTEDYALEIVGGRHPVVERMMPREQFIPNDTRLTQDARLISD